MSDPIERQAAIEAEERAFAFHSYAGGIARKAIMDLPPAEPEIIHCVDCAHGVHSGHGDIYLCTVSPEEVREHKYDFYCGYAERRTD